MAIVAVIIGGVFGSVAAAISMLFFGAGLAEAAQTYFVTGLGLMAMVFLLGLSAQRSDARDWNAQPRHVA